MNNGIYKVISKIYDLLDVIYFRQNSPREQILNCISDGNAVIIDICCGTLSNGINIASKKPNAKVVGLDISKPMLRIAKNKLQKSSLNNIYVKLGDACNTGLKANTFDYAILALVLHESDEKIRRKMLSEIKRILKPTGCIWHKPDAPAVAHFISLCRLPLRCGLFSSLILNYSLMCFLFVRLGTFTH